MPYWRTFFHIVWTTKNRHPMIGEMEVEIIGQSLKTTFDDLEVIPHAVGYMPDHVHVVVSIPPESSRFGRCSPVERRLFTRH